MKTEIKKLWVDALRSGKYKQTKRTLKNEMGFCCLGVLCDIHRNIFGQEWAQILDDVGDHKNYYFGSGSSLPKQVIDWAGLQCPNPTVGDFHLSAWNDRLKKNFVEIADLIEENL